MKQFKPIQYAIAYLGNKYTLSNVMSRMENYMITCSFQWK